MRVISPFAVVCFTALGGFNEFGLGHAGEGAIHGAEVRRGRFATGFDVLDDSVAVPFAFRKAEEDMKFTLRKGRCLSIPRSRSMFTPPMSICVAHTIYAQRI